MTQTPTITRNGVDKVLTDQVFGKKHQTLAGQHFPSPEVDVQTATDVTWLGADTINDALNSFLRREFADIFEDCLVDGQLNEALYMTKAAEFTAGYQSMGELEEQLEDLSAKQSAILDNPDFGAEVNDPTTNQPIKTPAFLALEAQMLANNTEIKKRKVKLAAIKAKYSNRAPRKSKNAGASVTEVAPATA